MWCFYTLPGRLVFNSVRGYRNRVRAEAVDKHDAKFLERRIRKEKEADVLGKT